MTKANSIASDGDKAVQKKSRSVGFLDSKEEIPHVPHAKRKTKSPSLPMPLVVPEEVKPIIKIPMSPTGRTRQAVVKTEHDKTMAIKTLSEGVFATKYTLKGVPKLRFFKVSDDGSQLMWKSKNRKFYTKILLASTKLLVIGPRSKPFERYSWRNGKPWQCLTIHCMDRTVDIEFHTKQDFMVWYAGLINLVPLNFNNKSLPMINWYRALFKTVQMSLQVQMPVSKVWQVLVQDSQSSGEEVAGEEESKQIMTPIQMQNIRHISLTFQKACDEEEAATGKEK